MSISKIDYRIMTSGLENTHTYIRLQLPGEHKKISKLSELNEYFLRNPTLKKPNFNILSKVTVAMALGHIKVLLFNLVLANPV